MTFDAHMHLAESAPTHYPATMSNIEALLEHQESHGFSASAIYTPMLISRTLKAGDDPFTAVRRYNAFLAELQARFPNKIAPAAISYPFGGDRAAKELHEDVKAYGFKAVMVNPYLTGRWLDQAPEAEPVLAAVEELDIPLIVHPEEGWEEAVAEAVGRRLTHNQGLVAWRTLATSTALYGFVCGDLLERHPGLRILFTHLAGDFFGLLGRFSITHERLLPADDPIVMQTRTNEIESPDILARLHDGQIYVDTAWALAEMIELAVKVLGADRVLLGTDGSPHPLSSNFSLEQMDALRAEPGTVEKIKWENASRFFRWGVDTHER